MDIAEFNWMLKDFEDEDLEFKQDISRTSDGEEKDRDVKTIVAFYNTRGGKLIFGVEEKAKERIVVGLSNPQTIETNIQSKLRGKCQPVISPKVEFIEIGGRHCLIINCPRGDTPPYRMDNKVYLRKGSNNVIATEEEIAQLYRDRSSNTHDTTLLPGATLEDIDFDAARTFLIEKRGISSQDDMQNLMGRMQLLGKDADNCYKPTIAGMLLFGKKPQNFLPQAKIKADAKFDSKSSDWDDIKEIEGTIFAQIKDAEQFARRNVKTSAKISGFERIEREQFPIEALREALINAVVHRDYAVSDAEILFSIRGDKVIITNPGNLIPPLTMAEILAGTFVPKTRNAVIARILTEQGFMDKRGSGFIRMRQLAKDFDLAEPSFNEIPSGFSVIFILNEGNRGDGVKKIYIPKEHLDRAHLSAEHKKILAEIEKKSSIKTADILLLLNVSRITALKKIDHLVQHGLIERIAKNQTDPNAIFRLHSRYTELSPQNKDIAAPRKIVKLPGTDDSQQQGLFGKFRG